MMIRVCSRARRAAPRRFSWWVTSLLIVWSGSSYAQVASPIASESSSTVVTGEVVWADLVTPNVEAAVTFYEDVFGWQARRGDDPGYVELTHDGEVICAVALLNEPGHETDPSSWLVSISVADVDDAAAVFVSRGGELLEPAQEFPDRGRFAVVSDDQGAVLMLLRSSGGDPVRRDYPADRWAWAELWTRDVPAAAAFYESVIGYDVTHAENGTTVLSSSGTPRATIVELPWEDVPPNWLPYVLVESVEKTLQNITTNGGSVLVTSDQVPNDSGTPAAIVADPTGGVFAIQEKGADE